METDKTLTFPEELTFSLDKMFISQDEQEVVHKYHSFWIGVWEGAAAFSPAVTSEKLICYRAVCSSDRDINADKGTTYNLRIIRLCYKLKLLTAEWEKEEKTQKEEQKHNQTVSDFCVDEIK